MDCKHLCVLVVVTFVYMAIGTFLFSYLEVERENENHVDLSGKLNSFIANHTCMTMPDLLYLLDTIETQSKHGTRMARKIITNTTDRKAWDHTGSLSYVVTLVTTIGYGHMVPDTTASKIISVFFALFGIPLTLVMLKELGGKLNHAIKCLYKMKFFKRAWLNKLVSVSIVFSLGLTLVVILPSLMFSHIENWSMVESMYYSFMTLSTVGFGDYVPFGSSIVDSPYHRPYVIFIYIWVLIGLVHVSLLISSISNGMVNNARLVEKHTLTKLEAEMRRLKAEMGKHKRNTCSFINHSDERTSRLLQKATLLRYNSLGVGSDSTDTDVINTCDVSSVGSTFDDMKRKCDISGENTGNDATSVNASCRKHDERSDALRQYETSEEWCGNGAYNDNITSHTTNKTDSARKEEPLEEGPGQGYVTGEIKNCNEDNTGTNALRNDTSTKQNVAPNDNSQIHNGKSTDIVLNPRNLINTELS